MSMTSPSRILLIFLLFANVVLAGLPLVDFDRMGTVGLSGTFAGLDLFQNSSIVLNPSTSTLLSRDLDGSLTHLASTNEGGRILASCTLPGMSYVAGSFSSIGGTAINNIASYTPSTTVFATVGTGGPNGEINALFCDAKESKVWVGGSFTSPGLNVAVWDPKAKVWSAPPFTGLSGAQSRVLSITTNDSDTSIFFAGSFITEFPGDGSPALNETNNPNVPPSTGATLFSSSLVPIPLKGPQVDGSPSTTDPQFSNIEDILCPSGDDGPGNSWFAADSSTPLITVRTFASLSVSGLRLGNTFQSNHGTTSFSVTTIPDNKVQTLHYRDPATGQTQACSDPCPLSTDASLLYQDFLFNDILTITGVQIKLSEFTGAAPGLHILQLLSSGAFASAVDSENGLSCYATNPSNTTRTGVWDAKIANTKISGTLQTVLVSSVDVGIAASDGPTFTWIPYVSASGNYELRLLIPGCTEFLNCASRTSVNITVFTGDGLAPRVTTISQQNPDDTSILLYSGPIHPSSSDSVTTVSMTLPEHPIGSGQGGKYELVADRVELILKSVNGSTSSSTTSGTGNAHSTINGFGFFEWPRNSKESFDATKTLPNSTLTPLDNAGIAMFKAAGGGGSSAFANLVAVITTVIHHPSGSIFLGGNFSLSATGSTNLAAFEGGVLVPLSQNGLNGPVTALLLVGDDLFVGGGFSDTSTGSTGGQLRGIACYNIQNEEWSPLGAGVDGHITSLGLVNGRLLVAGNFTQLLATVNGSTATAASGLAAWDIKRSAWVNSGGFMIGSLTVVGNISSSAQIVAGNLAISHRVGASGMVLLKNGDNKNGPIITPLGAQLDAPVIKGSVSPLRRRATASTSAWVSHFSRLKLSRYFSRQTPSTHLVPLSASLPAPAPAVLAGTFWTNTTSSVEVAIIGGNFSFFVPGSITPSQGVAVYDPHSAIVQGLSGAQLSGVVRSFLIDENHLYVGGEFTISGTTANGLAVYDLSSQAWIIDAIPALQGAAGSTVVVRSITKSASKPDTVIVAGTFSQAGSLRCQSICAYDTSSKQWNTLGNGIQGEVASIAYAGSDQELLFASGSIALSDNSVSNVVQFRFANATWTALGKAEELPGPVSTIEVNNGNASSIFAAGRSDDGPSSFLSFWNGINWMTLNSTLQGNTIIAQLTMVPLQDTHSVKGVIEPDRMLMVSGLLDDSSFGNASTALFDGTTFIPYIVSTSPTGSSGTVSSLFRSFSSFSFSHRRLLATGVVILISIAIAAGVVFLLALIGILWTLLSRREDKISNLDAAEDEDDDSTHHRPSSLLEHINAATRTTILGAVPFGANGENEEEKIAHNGHDPFGPDASNYIRAETPSDAVGGILAEESSRPAHARYSFDGAGEGELPISAGGEVEVLDDRDPAWWYARDVRTGQEGVVPAAYLY